MTQQRTLTVTLRLDWRAALQAAGATASRASGLQGEVLNFESPSALFSRLTERCWALVHALQSQGPMAVRELARRVGRDVKRVHENVQILAGLGPVERDAAGGVACPFAEVHIDLHLRAPAELAAWSVTPAERTAAFRYDWSSGQARLWVARSFCKSNAPRCTPAGASSKNRQAPSRGLMPPSMARHAGMPRDELSGP